MHWRLNEGHGEADGIREASDGPQEVAGWHPRHVLHQQSKWDPFGSVYRRRASSAGPIA